MTEHKNQRFNILTRETGITTQFLTSGLESMRKTHLNYAFYYQSFYAISMGLERLMKLILHIEQPEKKPTNFGHGLNDLAKTLNISFLTDSIEQKLLSFLNDFANNGRYMIVDFLYDNNKDRLTKEPTIRFYSEIIIPLILKHHPLPTKAESNNANLDDMIFTRFVKENLREINQFSGVILASQTTKHACKFATMYLARIVQPFKGIRPTNYMFDF